MTLCKCYNVVLGCITCGGIKYQHKISNRELGRVKKWWAYVIPKLEHKMVATSREMAPWHKVAPFVF